MRLGRSWVGDGYTVARDGRTLISSNGLRQFRPPTFKLNFGQVQAKFEGRWELEDTEDGQTVTLDNFQPLPGGQTNGSGFYLLKPQRFFGAVRLMRNTDLNEYYKRE